MWASGDLRSRRRRTRAFTLVELVMVVTIIGIISAIAVPRVSSSANNAKTNAVQASLSTVRGAVDCYYAEHNRFPGYNPANGSVSNADFSKQLVMYSDKTGNTNATRNSTFRYGPYLRPPFPTNPANNLNTVQVKATPAAPSPVDGSVGWVAVLSTGDFGVSASDTQLEDIGVVDLGVKSRLRLQN